MYLYISVLDYTITFEGDATVRYDEKTVCVIDSNTIDNSHV